MTPKTFYTCDYCNRSYATDDLALDCEEKCAAKKQEKDQKEEKQKNCEHEWSYELEDSDSEYEASFLGIARACHKCNLFQDPWARFDALSYADIDEIGTLLDKRLEEAKQKWRKVGG